MKYITLIIGLLVVGCTTPTAPLTLEEQKALREKVIGAYEAKKNGARLVMHAGHDCIPWDLSFGVVYNRSLY